MPLSGKAFECGCVSMRERFTTLCDAHTALVGDALERQEKQILAVKLRLQGTPPVEEFWSNRRGPELYVYDAYGRKVGIIVRVTMHATFVGMVPEIAFEGRSYFDRKDRS